MKRKAYRRRPHFYRPTFWTSDASDSRRAATRGRALRIEPLESRVLLSASHGHESLRPIGVTPFDTAPAYEVVDGASPGSASGVGLTLEETFQLHSRPGSNFTIYLDFDGHVTEGTTWNDAYGIASIVSPAYDFDGDPTTFSAAELDRIYLAWKRTAEDFAPFDINVTTEDPGVEALRRTGGGDTQWGARAVATADTFAFCGCGGHAYIDSFNDSVDTPTFVYNGGEGSLGETFSHEVGHMLNLSHDGRAAGGLTYYGGHGGGETSWGPIMGAPFDKNVTMWDSGEYFDTNNASAGANFGYGESDLGVIVALNGFSYRPDDHGDSRLTATDLNVANVTDVHAFGVIERSTDVDFFRFETGGGLISLAVDPLESRPNLDIWAGIYDAGGALVAQSNPAGDLSASFVNLNLVAGEYFVKIDGVGSHGVYNPLTDSVEDPASPAPWETPGPLGYSDYGSLGQYAITGTIVSPGANRFSIAPLDAVKKEGDAGTTPFTFTVSRVGNTGVGASVEYHVLPATPHAPGDTYPFAANGDDFLGGALPSGTASFTVGQASRTITINVAADVDFERDEHFVVVLSGASSGWSFSSNRAAGTILADEMRFGFAPGADSQLAEGPSDGVRVRWRQLTNSGAGFDEWGLDNIDLVGQSFADDFDPAIDAAQWTTITNGTANTAFGGSGQSLFMSGAGVRAATSIPMELSGGEMITFDLIFGDSANGGEDADAGEDVVLEYSADGGSTWVVINTYDTEDYTTSTTIQETLPPEANAAATTFHFTVQRVGDVTVAATVDWEVDPSGLLNPAGGDDFDGGLLPSGQLAFAAFETEKTISFSVVGDLVTEPDEQFRVRIFNPISVGAATIDPDFDSALGVILDDEAVVSIANETRFRFRQITHSNSNFDQWAIDNVNLTGTTFADDFTGGIDGSQWTSILNGVTSSLFGGDIPSLLFSGSGERSAASKGVRVGAGESFTFDLIIGDNFNGGDDAENGEDVVLEYSVDGGETWTLIALYDTELYTTWTNLDETIPEGAASLAPVLDEGDAGATLFGFTIARSGNVAQTFTVDWNIAGAGANPADAQDFVGGALPSGTITFLPGETSKTIEVLVAGDTLPEMDETFVLQLSNSTGGPIIVDSETATIRTDDPATPGDFDSDGDVDGDDFLIWQAAFNVSALGDADGDGDTDGDDFLIWQGNFGSGAGGGVAALSGGVDVQVATFKSGEQAVVDQPRIAAHRDGDSTTSDRFNDARSFATDHSRRQDAAEARIAQREPAREPRVSGRMQISKAHDRAIENLFAKDHLRRNWSV